ncbi:hypothetical protein F511_23389 [Dorcoceras hygrometricum]|uniref:Uncharacterized protein n=1 Tax=Dorcoceras hygrometricum TaxID=472368 RepID=A0A2Z7AHT4_9LAMI|nr:hypothetical protein F511_23389 [Dorcoceras hygrometricum]
MKSGKQVSLVGTRSPVRRSRSRIISANHDPQKAPGSDQFHEETGTSNARTDSPRRGDRNKSDHAKNRATAAAGGRRRRCAVGGGVRRVGEGIQLAVGPQPLWLRNHNFGLAQRIMVKRLATSRHDPLGITDSACKNQLVVLSVQYGPFNTYIPIRSTTIGKSRVARDPIAMHTSWRSNSDIASVTRVSMKFRVVRTNQYNQDLGLNHSTNGNHLESPNEGSSIDHQVTIHLHAQNITMFPTNETCIYIPKAFYVPNILSSSFSIYTTIASFTSNALHVNFESVLTILVEVPGYGLTDQKFCFGIFTSMVTSPAYQSLGYTVQINLLEKFTGVDLGESVVLHQLKVLNIKSVHTYKMKNASVVSDFVEVKHQIGEIEKIFAQKKLKPHEDSRANELRKKRIANRKATTGAEAITTKKSVDESSRPIKVQYNDSLEVAEQTSLGTMLRVIVGDCVEKMVVNNPNPEDYGEGELSFGAHVELAIGGSTYTVGDTHFEDCFVHWCGGLATKTIEIQEIDWVTHFVPKIDPAAKEKGIWLTLDRPNAVQEHFTKVAHYLIDDAHSKYDLMKWVETYEVSELLLRRELISSKMLRIFNRNRWQSTGKLPEFSVYGAPSDEQDPSVNGGKLQQRPAQSSMHVDEQSAHGQSETAAIMKTIAEHEAPDCAEETRTEPVLEQQAQIWSAGLQIRQMRIWTRKRSYNAPFYTKDLLAVNSTDSSEIYFTDIEEQQVPAWDTVQNNKGSGLDRDMAMAQYTSDKGCR